MTTPLRRVFQSKQSSVKNEFQIHFDFFNISSSASRRSLMMPLRRVLTSRRVASSTSASLPTSFGTRATSFRSGTTSSGVQGKPFGYPSIVSERVSAHQESPCGLGTPIYKLPLPCGVSVEPAGKKPRCRLLGADRPPRASAGHVGQRPGLKVSKFQSHQVSNADLSEDEVL